jgi:hypothetical protein
VFFTISTYWKKRVSLLPRKRRSGAPPSLPVAGTVIIVSVALPLLLFMTVDVVTDNFLFESPILKQKHPPRR